MVIVTGGDDQAICVAEVELHECDYSMKPFDEGSPQGRKTSCLDEKTSAGKRCGTVRTSLETFVTEQENRQS